MEQSKGAIPLSTYIEEPDFRSQFTYWKFTFVYSNSWLQIIPYYNKHIKELDEFAVLILPTFRTFMRHRLSRLKPIISITEGIRIFTRPACRLKERGSKCWTRNVGFAEGAPVHLTLRAQSAQRNARNTVSSLTQQAVNTEWVHHNYQIELNLSASLSQHVPRPAFAREIE